jgi:hypothetical protein
VAKSKHKENGHMIDTTAAQQHCNKWRGAAHETYIPSFNNNSNKHLHRQNQQRRTTDEKKNEL